MVREEQIARRVVFKKGKLLVRLIPIFLAIGFLNGQLLHAQQSNTLYLLHNVAQSNFLNPAVQSSCKLFIGLPVLGTVEASYANSGFSYNKLVDGNNFNPDAVYDGLNRMNILSAGVLFYPLSIGYKLKDNYFTFSIAERFSADLTYPGKLAGLVLYGNEQFIGDVTRLRNTRIASSYLREYSAGWSLKWDAFTSFGVRGKLLFGKANLNTAASMARIFSDPDTYVLDLLAAARLNSSFPLEITQNRSGMINNVSVPEINIMREIFNFRNPGLAIDLGVVHEYSEDITLSASILDLGVLLWTSDVNNLDAGIDYQYSGVNGTDLSNGNFLQDLYDSAYNSVFLDLGSSNYLTLLPAQLYLGASYKWKKNLNLGLTIHNRIINRTIRSSITGSLIYSLPKRVQASLSVSYLNNSILNMGAGLAYTGRGFQVYAVSDNVIGFIRPFDSKTIGLRFGMNLMLGCPGTKIFRKSEISRAMVPCPPGQGERKKRKW